MTDDAQSVCDNAKFKDIAKMPIDIKLLDLRISRSMGRHGAIGSLIGIIRFIKTLSLLIGMAVGKAVGDKLDKMDAKRNSRNRKIKFFLDKMKAEGEQQDSFAKLVKDLFVNKMAIPIKKIMVAVGGFLLVLVLLIAVTVLPVVAVIAILYNSPFAFFLPPLESVDTVTTVTSAYY